MHLPTDIQRVVQPLLAIWPLEQAMPDLVVRQPGPATLRERVRQIVHEPALIAQPALAAGLWLYVDDLDESHKVSQSIETATGSYWHGIMHRREGDFSNSHYWFRKVGSHPAISLVPAGYDPHRFIDETEKAYKAELNPRELVDLQRSEWATLFQWCANNPA